MPNKSVTYYLAGSIYKSLVAGFHLVLGLYLGISNDDITQFLPYVSITLLLYRLAYENLREIKKFNPDINGLWFWSMMFFGSASVYKAGELYIASIEECFDLFAFENCFRMFLIVCSIVNVVLQSREIKRQCNESLPDYNSIPSEAAAPVSEKATQYHQDEEVLYSHEMY